MAVGGSGLNHEVELEVSTCVYYVTDDAPIANVIQYLWFRINVLKYATSKCSHRKPMREHFETGE